MGRRRKIDEDDGDDDNNCDADDDDLSNDEGVVITLVSLTSTPTHLLSLVWIRWCGREPGRSTSTSTPVCSACWACTPWCASCDCGASTVCCLAVTSCPSTSSCCSCALPGLSTCLWTGTIPTGRSTRVWITSCTPSPSRA